MPRFLVSVLCLLLLALCGLWVCNATEARAGGMNNKARSDDWRIKLATPIFLLIEFILKTDFLARPIFENFRTEENVKQVLQNVYANKEAVDDELVELICEPGAALQLPPVPDGCIHYSLRAALLCWCGAVLRAWDCDVGKTDCRL